MKKRDITEHDLLGMVLIALGITLFTVISVVGGFSRITGMVVGQDVSSGDITTVYLLTFLIALAVAMSLLAIYLMRNKR